jgi:sugar lactone lactonase YvrE
MLRFGEFPVVAVPQLALPISVEKWLDERDKHMGTVGRPKSAMVAGFLALLLPAIGLSVAARVSNNGTNKGMHENAPVAPAATPTPTPIITTVAGSGRKLLGVGGPATQVNLGEVSGLARDSVGNLYVSDQTNNIVVKIAPSGTLTVFAGNGAPEYSGDGGPALQAGLHSPNFIVVDSSDNLYIADLENNRVRRVTPAGMISTFAGGGSDVNQPPVEGIAATSTFVSPNGLTIDSAGNVYVSDGNHKTVRKIRTDGTVVTVAGNGVQGFSGDGGPATSASIAFATGLAVDLGGNLYIADKDTHRIRKVTTDGIIQTIAGTGQCCYSGDGGLAVNAVLGQPNGLFPDTAGNLYFADMAVNVVRKISTDGKIATIIGTGAYGFSGDGGQALNATFKSIFDILMATAGNSYVTDKFNNRVRKIDSSGTITTIAGNGTGNSFGDGGPATSAGLNRPGGVVFDANSNMYIADTLNQKIRKVTKEGVISTIAGTGASGFSGDNGPAVNAMLNEPRSVAADSSGNIYISDFQNSRIRKIDKNGIISTYAGNGDCCNNSLGDGGAAITASIGGIRSIAVDSAGNLYISDQGHARIRKVDTSGIIATIAGNGQFGYGGDGGPATSASINPYAVAVESDGSVYISGPLANPSQVRKVDPQGIITRFAGDFGQSCNLNGPQPCLATQVTLESCINVAFDGHGGYFVGSEGFSLVTRVASDNTMSFLVGNDQGGSQGFRGDGGPALTALLAIPEALATDSAGDLYIADTNNDRIRKVSFHPQGLVGNVSTRLPVGTGDNVLIEGFIVQGPAGSTKKIIVRAIGPSLAPFGITDALPNPTLEIHDSNNGNAIVAMNDDWKVTQVGGLITADQSAEIAASGFKPGNDLESAIIANLAPGSYTAVVRGSGNSVGTAVVDAYDLSPASSAKLANIATRGLVQPGDKLMIAGFVVQGAPVKALVKAVGPSLAAFGVTNALPDTTLQLRDVNGAIVVQNDDWKVRTDGSSQQAEIEATGLQPTNDLEAAVLTTLQPGQYTAQVRGKPESTGTGVVQVYFLQ